MKTLALFLLLPLYLNAQTAGIVHAGPKGIFVHLGEHPAGMKFESYRIERAEGGSFKTVAEIPAIKDASEFQKNMMEAQTWVAYPLELTGYKSEDIWAKVKAAGSIQALKTLGQSLPVLAGFKLIWLDRSAKPGKTYQYRITAEGYNLLSEKFLYTLPQLSPLEVKNYRYLKKVFHFHFSSYGKNKTQWIEVYRGQSDKDLERIPVQITLSSSKDTLLYHVKDSSAEAYKSYRYAFKAYDVYGNTVPAPATVVTSSLDPTLLPLPAQVKVLPENKALRLQWQLERPEFIQNVSIQRSTSTEGPFQTLADLSPNTSAYLDETTLPEFTYFYRFSVSYKGIVDTKNSTLYSGILHDLTPPAPVPLFEGEETKTGTQLRWTLQEQGAGFHLYRQVNNAGYHLLTDLIPTEKGKRTYSYLDPHPGQGKVYQYYLTTLSKSYVEGLPSDTFTIVSQRAIPLPKVPIDLEIQQIDDQIWLSWADMPDAAGYAILRQAGKNTDTLYTDKNYYSEISENATYRIKSLSLAGKSSAFTAPVKILRWSIPPVAPTSLSARPLRSGGLQLQWEAPSTKTELQYHVYRYEKGKKPIFLAKTQDSQYLDKTVVRGKTFSYFVRSVDKDGRESENSRTSYFTY